MLDLKKFYNNIKLVYTKNEIEQLNSIYVKNYSQVSSFEELKEKFSNILHPMIEFEFHKQFDAQKGIQGVVLVELSIFATIAQIFNIHNFIFFNHHFQIKMVNLWNHPVPLQRYIICSKTYPSLLSHQQYIDIHWEFCLAHLNMY